MKNITIGFVLKELRKIICGVDYIKTVFKHEKNLQKVSLNKKNDEEAKYKLPKSYENW